MRVTLLDMAIEGESLVCLRQYRFPNEDPGFLFADRAFISKRRLHNDLDAKHKPIDNTPSSALVGAIVAPYPRSYILVLEEMGH